MFDRRVCFELDLGGAMLILLLSPRERLGSGEYMCVCSIAQMSITALHIQVNAQQMGPCPERANKRPDVRVLTHSTGKFQQHIIPNGGYQD
jgi:hypothetical protein